MRKTKDTRIHRCCEKIPTLYFFFAYFSRSHYLCIPLSFLLRGIMAERKKIFYAKKKAKVVRSTTWFYAVKLRKRAFLAAIIPLKRNDRGIKGSHTSREAWYPLFECVKQRIQESIGAVKRYQPYTSCSHRKSFFFQPVSSIPCW